MIKTLLGLPDYTPRDWLVAAGYVAVFAALFVVGGVFGS